VSPTHSHSPEELADRDANRVRLDLQQTLQNCIVIDLETTGLRPQEERIIEIAALHIRNGELQDKYTTLLNPNLSVPQEITDLTGISDGLLADKPTFSEVMPELLNFLRDATLTEPSATLGLESTPRLVGHNVSFDFSFLQHEILRTQLKNSADANRPYTPRLVCTAEASRTLIPRESVGRYRLGNVASYLKIPHRPLHRAMSDALATYDVLRALSTL
jgi:DNA polymerase III subunit epsilon